MEVGEKPKDPEDSSQGLLYLWRGLRDIQPWGFPDLGGIPVLSVSVGASHGAVLTVQGAVHTWGANDHGQRGIGQGTEGSPGLSLVTALTGERVVQVSCGADHTAAVTDQGEVWCWGRNDHGQCGVSDTRPDDEPSTDVYLPHKLCLRDHTPPCGHTRLSDSGHYPARVLQVAAGGHHTLAVTETGGLWAWGSGRALGLLTRNEARRPEPVPYLEGRRVLRVACGDGHSVAVVQASPKKATPKMVRPGARPTSPVVGAVQYHRHRPATCVRCKEEIYTYRELPDACVICDKHTCPLGVAVQHRGVSTATPRQRPSTESSESVSSDSESDRSPETTGTAKRRPQSLRSLDRVERQTSADSDVFTTSPGSPFIQRVGSFFQRVSNQPAVVSEMMTNIRTSVVSNIKTSMNKIGLAAGEEEALRRKLSPATEQLLGFGSLALEDVQGEDISHQLNIPKSKSMGLRDPLHAEPPLHAELRRKSSLPHNVDISRPSGGWGPHNEVVTDTEVWTWGDGDHGALGHGDTLHRSQPCLVAGLTDLSVVMVTAGDRHTIAITADCQVYTWGNNAEGQLGHSKPTTTSPTRVKLVGGAAVWAAAAGHHHSVLLADGAGFCPELFYAGKLPQCTPPSSPSRTPQFTYLRPPWQNVWVHTVCAGGSLCAAVGERNTTGLTATLHEYAATERALHARMVLMGDGFVRPTVDAVTADGQTPPQVTQLLLLLRDAATVLTHLVAVNHAEVSEVICGRLSLHKLSLVGRCDALVCAYARYVRCLCNLRVVRGLASLKAHTAHSASVLTALGLRSSVHHDPETDALTLLELPLARMGEYKRLVDKMALGFPAYTSDHLELSAVSAAWDALRQTAARDRKLTDNTMAFWDRLAADHPDKLEELRVPERRLLKQGTMLVNEPRKKDRRFALFNDILVYFKRSTSAVLALETLWVDIIPDSKKLSNAMQLTTPEETLTVIVQDRADWYCCLCDTISSLLSHSHVTATTATHSHSTATRSHTSPPRTATLSVPLDRQAAYTYTDHSQYRTATYDGYWRHGQPHGEGRMTWADGKNFIGRFKEGDFEYGMYALPGESSTPELQIGHWKDWKLHGGGEIRFANGDEFKGQFLDGKRYGHGVLTTEDHSVYTGEWTNDKRNGYGVEVQATEMYMGLWSDDQRHGGGVMVTMDDLYFEGNYSYNNMSGLGLLITDDGMCYEGQFSGGLFSLSGHGKITFPNGDYIEGRFQGTFTGGINVNGTLRKGQTDKDSAVFSLDEFKHDVEHRALWFGKLGVPSDRKWADIFSEAFSVLGCGLGQRPGEVSQDRVWAGVVGTVREKVSVLDFLLQRDLSEDPEASSLRLAQRFGLSDDLLEIPSVARDSLPLTVTGYRAIAGYVTKAFECPLHPLGKLIQDLVLAFTTTYTGRGLHPRLLHYAVEEVRAIVLRVYELLRILFVGLPDASDTQEPLPHHITPQPGADSSSADTHTHSLDTSPADTQKYTADPSPADAPFTADTNIADTCIDDVDNTCSTEQDEGQTQLTGSADHIPYATEPSPPQTQEEVYVSPEALIHPRVLPDVYPTLSNLYALYHARDDDAYWARLERWNNKPDIAIMVYLGVESQYWRSESMDLDITEPDSPVWKFKGMSACNNCYTQAVDTLQGISTAYSPADKLMVLKQTFMNIAKSLGDGALLGQDFLFPIFTFVVLRARIRQLGAEIHFIEDLMEPGLKTGELGHMVTDLSAAYHYLKNEDDRKSTSHH